MSDIGALPLSSRFARARLLSRCVAVLFALGFLVMLGGVVSGVLFVFFPTTASGVSHGIGFMNGFGVGFGSKRGWALIAAMVASELTFVPTVLVLYHLCKLFLCFAKGDAAICESVSPCISLTGMGRWKMPSAPPSSAPMASTRTAIRKKQKPVAMRSNSRVTAKR